MVGINALMLIYGVFGALTTSISYYWVITKTGPQERYKRAKNPKVRESLGDGYSSYSRYTAYNDRNNPVWDDREEKPGETVTQLEKKGSIINHICDFMDSFIHQNRFVFLFLSVAIPAFMAMLLVLITVLSFSLMILIWPITLVYFVGAYFIEAEEKASADLAKIIPGDTNE
jgi:hypothetical protein